MTAKQDVQVAIDDLRDVMEERYRLVVPDNASTAMRLAREKWDFINGILGLVDDLTEGAYCPLCAYDLKRDIANCEACLVSIYTEKPHCENTPYDDAKDAIRAAKRKVAAERDFLNEVYKETFASTVKFSE